MRVRFWLRYVLLLLCGLAVLLLGPGGETTAGAAPCCQGAKAARQGQLVCPLYEYANFEEYCSYYAEQCHDVWVSLDTRCEADTSGCDGPSPDCVNIGALAKKARKHHHHHKNLEKGIKNKKKPAKDATHPKGKMYTTQLGEPIIAELHTGKSEPKVALYLFLVVPKKKEHKPRIFGNGKEVKGTTKHKITLTPDHIVDRKGQVCKVRLGSVEYQVILHKDTK